MQHLIELNIINSVSSFENFVITLTFVNKR